MPYRPANSQQMYMHRHAHRHTSHGLLVYTYSVRVSRSKHARHTYLPKAFWSHTDCVAAFPFGNRRESQTCRERESTASKTSSKSKRVNIRVCICIQGEHELLLCPTDRPLRTAKQHQQHRHRHIKARNVCTKLFS